MEYFHYIGAICILLAMGNVFMLGFEIGRRSADNKDNQ